MWNSASFNFLYLGLIAGQTVLAKDSDPTPDSSSRSKFGPTTTITETTWVYPVVTLNGPRERQCTPQPLDFCENVYRSMFSIGSMTGAPSPTSTATLEGPFAIEVQTANVVTELIETQYLAIAGDYVVLYPGPHIPGWFIDSDGNLIFDNTGLRLGISPLDSQTSKRKRLLEQNSNGYDTIIAGAKEASSGANVFTNWNGSPKAPTIPLQILDQSNNAVNLGFMACKFNIPEFGVEAWQLEATYNVEKFLLGSQNSNVVDPAFCASVRLLPVTSVPVSTAVSSHTSNYISRSSSVVSVTPTPTETLTSFPIQVDFDTADAGYYIEEDGNGYAYIDITSNPPYYRYINDTGLLVSEVTGNYLKITVIDTPSTSSSKTSRQISNGDNFQAAVDGDTLIPAGVTIPTFVVCPPSTTSTSASSIYSLILAYNPDNYIQQNPDLNCTTASLSLDRTAPTPSTTFISTTVTTTELPTVTATALSPNVIGCNALNYTLAYSTTGIMNSFATACWCYSFLASTISDITTQDCTPTIYKVVPSITSISVSGVISSTNSNDGATRTDRESINSRDVKNFILPRNTTVGTTTITIPVSTTDYDDITVVPTPTGWFSAVDASPAYFTSFCSTLLEGNGVETLTITSLSVVSSTVSVVTISQTTVQTVCYQEVWEPAVTMSTPAIVVCPATVTGSS
ncbi:hypothetical protein TWF718_002995 [Orbilia javanica]|uniref:Uncharacterized protein n=1 Tax=Orbilia javanica TaxID=47235 RepID=A0AAN8RAI1_9PEZI